MATGGEEALGSMGTDAALAVLSPYFFSARNFTEILLQAAILGIVSVGTPFVIEVIGTSSGSKPGQSGPNLAVMRRVVARGGKVTAFEL